MARDERHPRGTARGEVGSTSPAALRAPQRDWTFLVYMAGDNNLEAFGRPDLMEMKQVGSTTRVAVVAQFDDLQQRAAQRYYLRRDTSLEEDRLPSDGGEINTGDPRELVYFLAWGMNTYPAKRYALVLWNHGSGWKEDDIYSTIKVSAMRGPGSMAAVGSLIREMIGSGGRSTLFAPTLESIVARGIAYDDSSRDFLDNAELKRALGCALLAVGVERLDVVGFDACLMSMLEVAYQLRNDAHYLVGSQETEPGEGWPYHEVLRALVDRPQMGGADLAANIVEAYARGFGGNAAITQSALSLDRLKEVVLALDELCAYALDQLPACELALGWAARRAQKYTDPDYKDLYDFCRLLAERTNLPDLQARARTVMERIAPPGAERFVRAEAHQGAKLADSHGVSIYFPTHAVSPFYRRLDFASETLWDDLLLHLTISA